MALKKSEELLQAKNRVHQAELDNKIAGTAYLPNVSGSAIGAYILPDLDMMGMELRMRGTYMAGLSLTQPVYTGGRINAGKRMAKIGEEVAGEQLRMTRMEIIVEVCNSYWSYVAVGEKVKMLESYVVQMDTLYGQVSTAVKAGMATENDLLRVEAERSNIRYQLQKASNGKEMCSMSLCRLIGADSGTAIEAADTVIATCGMQNLAAGIEKRPEHLFQKTKKRPTGKWINIISFVLTLFCVALVLVLALTLLIPELVRSFQSLYAQVEANLPQWIAYLNRPDTGLEWLRDWIDNTDWEQWLHSISDGIDVALASAVDAVSSTVNTAVTAAFASFVMFQPPYENVVQRD